MADMTGQAFPLLNRQMDAPHFLVLSLFMTLQAEYFRFLRQHVDIIAGMGRVTIRTVPYPERFMKPGSLILLLMAVDTERVNVFRAVQFTGPGNTMTGLTVAVDNRFMDYCLQKSRSFGTMRRVTGGAFFLHAISGMGLPETSLLDVMA
jgi:hypothetical protein